MRDDGLTSQSAAQEILRRQRSRGSLLAFSQSIEIPGVPIEEVDDEVDDEGKLIDRTERKIQTFTEIETRVALHHRVIMAALQKCIETPRGRLMIFAPPGSAKSTYASVIAPAWAMGRKRNQQIILASYAANIAVKQSRKVRAIVRTPAYASIWPEKPMLLDDQRAVDDWSLNQGSAFMAAGFMGGITGNRADGFIIDDPIANREQADSPTIREKIYDEYIDTVMTRAKPKMWCVIIQTRWQEEDLAGAILPEYYEGESGLIACRDGQSWNVLCIPAEAERADDPLGRKPGEFLWPEWFPREHWSTWRDNPRAARTWAALYQQRPAPASGIHFSRNMFKLYDPNLPRI